MGPRIRGHYKQWMRRCKLKAGGVTYDPERLRKAVSPGMERRSLLTIFLPRRVKEGPAGGDGFADRTPALRTESSPLPFRWRLASYGMRPPTKDLLLGLGARGGLPYAYVGVASLDEVGDGVPTRARRSPRGGRGPIQGTIVRASRKPVFTPQLSGRLRSRQAERVSTIPK